MGVDGAVQPTLARRSRASVVNMTPIEQTAALKVKDMRAQISLNSIMISPARPLILEEAVGDAAIVSGCPLACGEIRVLSAFAHPPHDCGFRISTEDAPPW